MAIVNLTLVGKPDCHLCAEAEEIVREVCEQRGVNFESVSILDDPELADLYWEQIPVLLIDGKLFDFWRINRERLEKKLDHAH